MIPCWPGRKLTRFCNSYYESKRSIPGYGLYDAVQLVIGGWVSAPLREHEVDGVKEARERLGQVRGFIWL